MDTLTFLETAQAVYRSAEYEKALGVIADAELAGKASVELLLLKGACVQLAASTDFPVSRALQVYTALLARRPEDPRVLEEIGFYYLNVEDDAASAKEYFDKAVDAYGHLMRDALIGLAEASVAAGTSRERALLDARASLARVGDLVEERLLAMGEPRSNE